MMEYRVEDKYIVTDAQLRLIAARIRPVMTLDPHMVGGFYAIRSLYFDDYMDRCMEENAAGVDQRQKFRIRIYDPASPSAHLEIKEKLRGLTKKRSCVLRRSEIRAILEHRMEFAPDARAPLNLLMAHNRCEKLEPKVIISYDRTAFIHPLGNVRVTFDRNITASRVLSSFLEAQVPCAVPVLPKGFHVLEVKYDEFLPDCISRQLELGFLQKTAFSKYYLGRLALRSEFPGL